MTRGRTIRRYLDRVALRLEADPGEGTVVLDSPAWARFPLRERLDWCPERMLAAQWDEENGWSLMVSTTDGRDWVPTSYLGVDVLATPRLVAWFVRDLIAGGDVGMPYPPDLRAATDRDDFELRLASYAVPQGFTAGDGGHSSGEDFTSRTER